MKQLFPIIVSAIVAFVCTCWIRPYILKVAKVKSIVDNPDARKLQRVPVPLLGGLTVVFGILSGVMTLNLYQLCYVFFPIITAIIIIMIIGFIDDTILLSSKVRFFIEVIIIIYLIQTNGFLLNNFHGLWGLQIIPDSIAYPLTIFACVGIINAINLIDGIDGYSSGYTIISSILFGIMFYTLGNIPMVALTAIVTASLLPFFFHNVFGKHSKMFIGDAGTLSLGVVFCVFISSILSNHSNVIDFQSNIGFIPFTLAVLCVPVFDTLRVMSARIWRRKSPFKPDKTHLHHLFIELGYSHIGTVISIIVINLTIIFCWFLAYKCGLSIDTQLYIVLTLGVFVTFIFYPCVKTQIRNKTKIYHFFHSIAKFTHIEHKSFWLFIQKWADKSTNDMI